MSDSEYIEGTLSFSPTRGRYQVGDADETAPDLTSGASVAIYLGGQWIDGVVWHASVYASRLPNDSEVGYYFSDLAGYRCGICVGMKVRLY